MTKKLNSVKLASSAHPRDLKRLKRLIPGLAAAAKRVYSNVREGAMTRTNVDSPLALKA